MGSAALTVEPVSPAIAEEAACLRATHGLRTPDAVQLATARLAGAQSFLTNDADLAGIPGLEVIVPDQLLADE